jgi:hypothetical protein
LDIIVSIEICREVPRWRKSSTIVNNLSSELCYATHELNDKEKQLVLRRFLDKDHVKCLLPELVRNAKDVEHKLNLFNSLKVAYA